MAKTTPGLNFTSTTTQGGGYATQLGVVLARLLFLACLGDTPLGSGTPKTHGEDNPMAIQASTVPEVINFSLTSGLAARSQCRWRWIYVSNLSNTAEIHAPHHIPVVYIPTHGSSNAIASEINAWFFASS